MKKILSILAVTILISSIALAQSNKEEIEYYQSIFGMEKKAIVADFLELEADSSFWLLYDQYETERKALGQTRLKLLDEYAESYLTLDDEKTDKIIEKIITQKKSLDKLIVTYYKKIKKESGSKSAAQFYQLENYFLSAIRMAVLESIPFIGEFE